MEKHTGFFNRYDHNMLTRRPLMWLTKLHIIGPVALLLIPLLFILGLCRRLPLQFSSEDLFTICGLLSLLCCIMLIWWQSRVKTRNLSSAQARTFALYSSVSYFAVILLCSAYVIGYHIRFSHTFDIEAYNKGLTAYHQELFNTINANHIHNEHILEGLKQKNIEKESKIKSDIVFHYIFSDSTQEIAPKADKLILAEYAAVSDSVKGIIYDFEVDSYIYNYMDSTAIDSSYIPEYEPYQKIHNTLNEILMLNQKGIFDDNLNYTLINHLAGENSTYEQQDTLYYKIIAIPNQSLDSIFNEAKAFYGEYQLPSPLEKREMLVHIDKSDLKYISKNYIDDNDKYLKNINTVIESDFMLLFKIGSFLLLFCMVCSQVITSAINNVEAIVSILCALIIGSVTLVLSVDVKNVHEIFSTPEFLISVACFIAIALILFKKVNGRPNSFIVLFIIHLAHFIFIYILFLGGLALVERLVYSGLDNYGHENRNTYLITTFISLPLCFLLHYFFIKKYNKLFHLPRP